MLSNTVTAGPVLSDDLVWGAEEIGKEIGLEPHQVFYKLARGQLPAKKIGTLWVASRSQLKAHLTGEAM